MMKEKVFLIGEIGINHNGDVNNAIKLIDYAKRYDWQAVKFQTRNLENVIPREMWNKPKNTPWGELKYIDYKKRIELTKEDYDKINEYCNRSRIDWFSSAWDLDSQKFLKQYNLKYNKVASPMLTHKKLLEQVAKEGKKTFISTAMSIWSDIDYAVEVFRKYDCPFVLMHCVGLYPAPNNTLNLSLISKIKERYDCEVGYSGHSSGVLDAPLAVVYGARYIEKHITLDRTMWGSDQSASLEPRGMEIVRKYCDATLEMIGDGEKKILPKEKEIAKKLRYWER